MDLPFHKVGIAHLTCELMSPGKFEEVLSLIPDTEMERLFAKAAEKGVGIELNFYSKRLTADSDIKYDPDTVLRPYRVAKEAGLQVLFRQRRAPPRRPRRREGKRGEDNRYA